jgi:hypothetical protein
MTIGMGVTVKSGSAGGGGTGSFPMDASKSIKAKLAQNREAYLTANPESQIGKSILREKFSLPAPVMRYIQIFN